MYILFAKEADDDGEAGEKVKICGDRLVASFVKSLFILSLTVTIHSSIPHHTTHHFSTKPCTLTIPMPRSVVNLLRLSRYPILEQLWLEEALFRSHPGNWFVINDGVASPTIVLGISGYALLLSLLPFPFLSTPTPTHTHPSPITHLPPATQKTTRTSQPSCCT